MKKVLFLSPFLSFSSILAGAIQPGHMIGAGTGYFANRFHTADEGSTQGVNYQIEFDVKSQHVPVGLSYLGFFNNGFGVNLNAGYSFLSINQDLTSAAKVSSRELTRNSTISGYSQHLFYAEAFVITKLAEYFLVGIGPGFIHAFDQESDGKLESNSNFNSIGIAATMAIGLQYENIIVLPSSVFAYGLATFGDAVDEVEKIQAARGLSQNFHANNYYWRGSITVLSRF